MMKNIIILFFFLCSSTENCFPQEFFNYKDKQELLKSLHFYNYPDTSYIKPSLTAFDKVLFNDKNVNDKMIFLFQNKWTENEEKAWAKFTIERKLKGKFGLRNLATQIAEKKKISYNSVLDSLIQIERSNVKEYLSKRRVNDDVIRQFGLLDDPSFIPYLKNALDDPLHYDTFLVKLSLARLNVNPYHDELISRFSYRVLKNKKSSAIDELLLYREAVSVFNFVASQESILELSKWLKSKTITRPLPDADDVTVPLTSFVIEDIRGIVINSEFKEIFPKDEWTPITKEHIKLASEWLTKNYGKYELRR